MRAVLQLMEEPTAAGRVFNIGSDQPVSILKLAEQVRSLVNPQAKIEFQSYRQAYDDDFEDIRRRVPDLTRLRNTIDYRPQHTLESIDRRFCRCTSFNYRPPCQAVPGLSTFLSFAALASFCS